MDDTPEDKAPSAKAGTGRKSSRTRSADAPAGKAKESKARASAAQRSKPEETKPARKAPAKRKSQAGTEAAAKPATAPKAKASRPAKEKMARKPRGKAAAKPASAPEVPAHAAAPAQAPVTRVDPTSVKPQQAGKTADVAIHPVPPHAPSLHPHDEGLEFGLSPVDLPPDPGVREEAGFGWFVRILVLSSVLLVLFNSFAIDKWAREQPVTRLNSQVLIAARQIHGAMKSLHLDAPVEGMRSLWHGIKAVQWPGSAGNGEKAGAEQPPAKRPGAGLQSAS